MAKQRFIRSAGQTDAGRPGERLFDIVGDDRDGGILRHSARQLPGIDWLGESEETDVCEVVTKLPILLPEREL